jgi:hypothetical protein
MRGKQPDELPERQSNVSVGGVVVAFADDERLCSARACGALAPASAPRAHDAFVVDKDDFACLRVDGLARSEVGDRFVACGESYGDGTRDPGLIEEGDR